MRLFFLFLFISSAVYGSPSSSQWEVVHERVEKGQGEIDTLNIMMENRGEFGVKYLTDLAIKRQMLGQSVKVIKSISITHQILKYVGADSTCQEEDQRLYHWASFGEVNYATEGYKSKWVNKPVAALSWNPCGEFPAPLAPGQSVEFFVKD